MDKYNILIAEDDKEIARSIGIYLKNENFEIFYAGLSIILSIIAIYLAREIVIKVFWNKI